jgi:low temperature requirement protein LtrA
MVERFGLFSIIVLGEIVVGVVGGVTAHHHLDWIIGLTGALGALIAIALWWVYFDYVSHHLPRAGAVMVSLWFYLHLPLTMGIASVGAAVLNVVEHAGEPLPSEVQWLLVGALAVALLSIATLDRTIQIAPEHRQTHRAGRRVMAAAAVLIGLLGLFSLEVIPMLAVLVLLMLAPIYTGLRRWLVVVEANR